jgi:serine/threonine-protein kinase
MVVAGGGYATDSGFAGAGAGVGAGGARHGRHHTGEPVLQRWLFSRRLAVLAVAAAAVIAIGIGGWWLTSGRYSTLPSVDGMSYAAAAHTLQAAGFSVREGTQVVDNNVPKGYVVSTAPSGRAEQGATIVLTVSSGPRMITVPPVAGKKLQDAIALLRQAGLTVSSTPKDVGADGVPVGTVSGTTPAAGTSWPATSVVYVNVVTGIALPPLVGENYGVIQGWAQTNNIQLDPVQVASSQPAGVIVRQSPAPGTPVPPNGTVTVYVSSGPAQVPIPDLRGQRFEQAQKQLQQLGFQVQGRQFGPGDTVFGTNPSGSAAQGSTIVVFYGGL